MDAPHAKIARLEDAPSVPDAAPVSPSSLLSPSCALEALPRELLWKVIEYVPEVAGELMMTSKLMRHSVDKYALHANIPLVERITFGSCRLPNSTTPETACPVWIDIGETKKVLFYRRLAMVQNTQASSSTPYRDRFFDMVAKNEPIGNATKQSKSKALRFEFDAAEEGADKKMSFLCDCIGRRVAKVVIVETSSEQVFECIERMLLGKQIINLVICTAHMFDANIVHLKKAVLLHNIVGLDFRVTGFETTVNTLDVLRDLANEVRSIKITQHSNNTDSNAAQGGGTFLFGKSGADWPKVFIDMLSAPKLEKLVIENKNNLDYISDQDAYTIIDRVTALPDSKPVWFEATCNTFVEEYSMRKKNAFNVQADKKDTKGSIRIKHASMGPLEVPAVKAN